MPNKCVLCVVVIVIGLCQFYEDGLLVIENFASDEEIDAMRAECHELVEKMNPAEHQTVFSTTKQVSCFMTYFSNSIILNKQAEFNSIMENGFKVEMFL